MTADIADADKEAYARRRVPLRRYRTPALRAVAVPLSVVATFVLMYFMRQAGIPVNQRINMDEPGFGSGQLKGIGRLVVAV